MLSLVLLHFAYLRLVALLLLSVSDLFMLPICCVTWHNPPFTWTDSNGLLGSDINIVIQPPLSQHRRCPVGKNLQQWMTFIASFLLLSPTRLISWEPRPPLTKGASRRTVSWSPRTRLGQVEQIGSRGDSPLSSSNSSSSISRRRRSNRTSSTLEDQWTSSSSCSYSDCSRIVVVVVE